MSNTDRKIALVDMDGTIADYDGSMAREFDRLIGPGELSYLEACRVHGRMSLPDHLWNRCQLIKSRDGWWKELPLLQAGDQIMTVLIQLGYEIHIASRGPAGHPQAWAEKVQWVRNHYGNVVKAIHITEDKSMLQGDVLVDDWYPYCSKWAESNLGGRVIMPAHDYNEGCPFFRYKLGMQAQLIETLKQ